MSDHMAWFHDWKARIRAADAALGIEDPVEAARQLCARQVPLPPQLFRWGDAKRLTKKYGDWVKILKRADGRSNSNPPTAQEVAAQDAAINAVSLADDELFDPADADAMLAFQVGIAALRAVGDLSPNTTAKIVGLPNKSVPEFDPQPTEHDLVTLRNGG